MQRPGKNAVEQDARKRVHDPRQDDQPPERQYQVGWKYAVNEYAYCHPQRVEAVRPVDAIKRESHPLVEISRHLEIEKAVIDVEPAQHCVSR